MKTMTATYVDENSAPLSLSKIQLLFFFFDLVTREIKIKLWNQFGNTCCPCALSCVTLVPLSPSITGVKLVWRQERVRKLHNQ